MNTHTSPESIPAQHIPGEWERSGNQLIAIHTDEDGDHETLIADIYDGHDWHRANMRLLRSAPALLRALQNLYEHSRREAAEAGMSTKEMTWLTEARNAIAETVLCPPYRTWLRTCDRI